MKWMILVGSYTRPEGHVDGRGKGIYAFGFDLETKNLKFQHLTTTHVGINPTFLTVSSDNQVLYVINEHSEADGESGCIQAFQVQENGQLVYLNEHVTNGGAPCHLAIQPTEEKYVAVANYVGGSISVCAIQEDGTLSEATDTHQFTEASKVNPNRQEAPHAHGVSWSMDGKVLYAADLGNDTIYQFAVDQGYFRQLPSVRSRPGAGPRHISLHPTLSIAYVVEELSNSIAVYEYDVVSHEFLSTPIQEINTLPDTFSGEDIGTASELECSANGSFLYCSNRVLNKENDTIACYRIDASSGKLTLLGHVDTLGSIPRHFAVHEDWVFVANQDSDTIVPFQINAATGLLEQKGNPVKCPSPVCLSVIPLSD